MWQGWEDAAGHAASIHCLDMAHYTPNCMFGLVAFEQLLFGSFRPLEVHKTCFQALERIRKRFVNNVVMNGDHFETGGLILCKNMVSSTLQMAGGCFVPTV